MAPTHPVTTDLLDRHFLNPQQAIDLEGGNRLPEPKMDHLKKIDPLKREELLAKSYTLAHRVEVLEKRLSNKE